MQLPYRLGLMAVLLALGISLRLSVQGVGTRTPDERNYTREAATLLHAGDAGFPALCAIYRASDHDIPSPTRAGYLLLLKHTMQFTGDESPRAGADLSCAAAILCLLLVAIFAWRALPFSGALAATLLYAASPFALMTSRRAWEESVVEATSLALLLLASEIIRGASNLGWYAAFAAVGAFAVTLKETGALSFFFCAVWVAVSLLWRRERKQALLFAGCCVVAAELAIFWLAHMVGGLDTLLDFTRIASQTVDMSRYSIAYEGGPPWLLLEGIFAMSAATTLALLAVPAAFPSMQRRIKLTPDTTKTAAGLLGFVLAMLAIAMLAPHHLNLRYVCPVFAPLALLSGLGFAVLAQALQRLKLPPSVSLLLTALAACILVAVTALDLFHFRDNFVKPDVQDLAIQTVLNATQPRPPAP